MYCVATGRPGRIVSTAARAGRLTVNAEQDQRLAGVVVIDRCFVEPDHIGNVVHLGAAMNPRAANSLAATASNSSRRLSLLLVSDGTLHSLSSLPVEPMGPGRSCINQLLFSLGKAATTCRTGA